MNIQEGMGNVPVFVCVPKCHGFFCDCGISGHTHFFMHTEYEYLILDIFPRILPMKTSENLHAGT